MWVPKLIHLNHQCQHSAHLPVHPIGRPRPMFQTLPILQLAHIFQLSNQRNSCEHSVLTKQVHHMSPTFTRQNLGLQPLRTNQCHPPTSTLTCRVFHRNITTTLMCSVKARLLNYLNTDPMITLSS